MTRLLIIIATMTSCRGDTPPSMRERYQAYVVTLDEDPRDGTALAGMLDLCCPPSGGLAEACIDLTKSLSRRALGDLFMEIPEDCLNRMSGSISEICVSDCSPAQKRWFLAMVPSLDPTPAIEDAVFRILRDSFDPHQPGFIADRSERDSELRTPQEQVRDAAEYAMARFGEHELETIMRHAMRHANPGVRRWMISAVDAALQLGPLLSPRVLAAVQEATLDGDPTVADAAGKLWTRLRQQRREAFENVVESLARITTQPDDAIRILAVRRFSCAASTAEGAIRVIGVENPHHRDAAERAIALRLRRCASLAEAPLVE